MQLCLSWALRKKKKKKEIVASKEWKASSSPPVANTPRGTENKRVYNYERAKVSRRSERYKARATFSHVSFFFIFHLVSSWRLRHEQPIFCANYKFSRKSFNRGVFAHRKSVSSAKSMWRSCVSRSPPVLEVDATREKCNIEKITVINSSYTASRSFSRYFFLLLLSNGDCLAVANAVP